MKNIIELYFDNNKLVPFVVRRENWNDVFGILVTEVRPRKTATGWYGDVKGFPLPPLNGVAGNDYWGQTGCPAKVSCAGCYQWTLVKDVPEQWQKFMDQRS